MRLKAWILSCGINDQRLELFRGTGQSTIAPFEEADYVADRRSYRAHRNALRSNTESIHVHTLNRQHAYLDTMNVTAP